MRSAFAGRIYCVHGFVFRGSLLTVRHARLAMTLGCHELV